ncbi:MAG: hypothetical protein HY900_17275, partial [Deltaproteobacteria bacterium]|nr:hypothetical protein [Deltaproteobacteria bacterium]
MDWRPRLSALLACFCCLLLLPAFASATKKSASHTKSAHRASHGASVKAAKRATPAQAGRKAGKRGKPEQAGRKAGKRGKPEQAAKR